MRVEFRHTRGPNGWRVSLPFCRGVRASDHIVVSVAADQGDLTSQVQTATSRVREALDELDADQQDLVKLVLYYVPEEGLSEAHVLELLARQFALAVPPALMHVALPRLAYEGQRVALEAIAMRAPEGARMAKQALNPPNHWSSPFSHGVRCGEMIYVGAQMPLDARGELRFRGDPVAQARLNIELIGEVLAAAGAELDDVARINSFYVGQGTEDDWARVAQVRANAFTEPGPCGAGIPVPALHPDGVAIRQEVIAMRALDGSRLPRRSESPPGHWHWPIRVTARQGVLVGDKLFVGGQGPFDAAGKVVAPGSDGEQILRVLGFIDAVLRHFGASSEDVLWMKSYHKSSADEPKRLHEVLVSTGEYTGSPGPAMTAVPFPLLGIDPMILETDAFAILPARSR